MHVKDRGEKIKHLTTSPPPLEMENIHRPTTHLSLYHVLSIYIIHPSLCLISAPQYSSYISVRLASEMNSTQLFPATS